MDSDSKLTKTSEKIKIAIVGAGISGCSSAYFLNDLFDDNVEITVFEKSNKIGGRLATVDYQERSYELGGSILHSSNLYMKQFLTYLGLEKREDGKDSDEFTGFFNSKGILISMDGAFFGIWDKIKMFKYFGFGQLISFTRWIEEFIKKFTRIYKLQEAGFTFKNMKEFAEKIDPDLYKASNTSIKNILESKGFNERIVDELTNIACLANYGQSNLIDGFVGLVSICGTVGDLWCVKGGNKQVPEGLLQKSGAIVMKETRVKSISKNLDNPEKNMVVYETVDNQEVVADNFDYVLVGLPVYNGVLGADFNLDFESNTEFDAFKMQRTNTYFISGTCKLFPNLPATKRNQLLSVDPKFPYRTCCVQLPCDYERKKDSTLFLKDGPKLYKVFSEVNLSTSDFEKMFETGYELVEEMPWLAYPKYQENTDLKQMPDIVLDSETRQRVYYLNAMEWSSSCMEISCISARNVSLLIAQKEKELASGKKLKKFFNSKFLRDELVTKNSLLHGVCLVSSILSILAFLVTFYFNRN